MKKSLPFLLLSMLCMAAAALAQGVQPSPGGSDSPLFVVDAHGKVLGEYNLNEVQFRVNGAWVRAGLVNITQNGETQTDLMRFFRFPPPQLYYASTDCSGIGILPVFQSFSGMDQPGFRIAIVVADGDKAKMVIGAASGPSGMHVNSFGPIGGGSCDMTGTDITGTPIERTVMLSDIYAEPFHLRAEPFHRH